MLCIRILGQLNTTYNFFTDQFVHVKFCANKGSSGWVKMENVFEFQGIESFLERKKAMTSVRPSILYIKLTHFEYNSFICVLSESSPKANRRS